MLVMVKENPGKGLVHILKVMVKENPGKGLVHILVRFSAKEERNTRFKSLPIRT